MLRGDVYRFKLPNGGVGHKQQGDRFGVGKTTVEFEISDVLGELGVPNAAVDLDSIIVMWPWTSRWHSDLVFQNLTSLWPNYLLEDAGDLDRYRHAVPGAAIMVIGLVAPDGMRVSRLTARIPEGPSREWHVARTVELEEVLERAGYEDFVVDNGDRPVREVALEILQRSAVDLNSASARREVPPNAERTFGLPQPRTSSDVTGRLASVGPT